MKTTCIVSSYNYRNYVADAVDSALAQTVPLDEIIVVDDGSTDGSREFLERRYQGWPPVRIVAKGNGGQLSCFNAGFRASSGDVIFFLDADDTYEPTYVAQSLKVHAKNSAVDFVFAAHRYFGQRQGVAVPLGGDCDLGYSAVLTFLSHGPWIGAPTSCLSLRRTLLERILPLPLEADWRIRADDCLVYGGSLASGHKYFLSQPLVNYRVHGENAYFLAQQNPDAEYRYHLAVERLFGWFTAQMRYDPEWLARLAAEEFRTIDQPTYKQFRTYWRIVWRSRMSLHRRWRMWRSLRRHLRAPVTSPAPDLPVPVPGSVRDAA